MTSNKINISGIDKISLLRALWENQKIAAFFTNFPKLAPSFDEDEAKEAVKDYIDYFRGRAIKANISGDEMDSFCYDRDAGNGTALKVVSSLKKM
jgi:hypothetical protein